MKIEYIFVKKKFLFDDLKDSVCCILKLSKRIYWVLLCRWNVVDEL